MIDPAAETLLPVSQARRHAAFQNRDGSNGSIHKVYRAIQSGYRDADGRRVRLESVRLPAGIFTSAEAVVRFIAALNQTTDIAPRRDAAADLAAAEAELELAGI